MQKKENASYCILFFTYGGDGGSWTRVRQHYAHDSTCLDSVYGFNGRRTDSQDANHEPLKFCSNWRDNNLSYPSCVRFKESNQTNGNLCRPKQPLGC